MNIALNAGLWYAYGREARPDIQSRTTFQAVIAGERVSTTRFLSWPGHRRWAALKPGDLVRLYAERDMKGASLVVEIESSRDINLATCSEELIQQWSRCEGWSVSKGRGLGKALGPALWLRHKLVHVDAQTAPAQASLF